MRSQVDRIEHSVLSKNVRSWLSFRIDHPRFYWRVQLESGRSDPGALERLRADPPGSARGWKHGFGSGETCPGPAKGNHPRGWNSSRSHERKVQSYQVETTWYRQWSQHCDVRCRIPKFLAFERHNDEVLLVLEDLDGAGFPSRLTTVDWTQVEICLEWLAHFHATFLGREPCHLWKIGTYWHLDTRPEELEALADAELKKAAKTIDARLNAARYQTLVHGDAKLANFCFSEDGERVAAVDFQYVGGGCGMKDVAYFIGSCLDERACEEYEARLLDSYFTALEEALAHRQPELDSAEVIAEWQELFPIAWTDFHRFLKGWSPGHWKLTGYSERIAREVLATL